MPDTNAVTTRRPSRGLARTDLLVAVPTALVVPGLAGVQSSCPDEPGT